MLEFPYFFEQGNLISIPAFPLGEGLTSIVIQSGKPLLLENTQAITSLTGKVVGRDAKSWMGIPLIFSGTIMGAVLLQDLDHENRFSQDDVTLYSTLAPQIATAVRNAELFSMNEAMLAKNRLLRQITISSASSTKPRGAASARGAAACGSSPSPRPSCASRRARRARPARPRPARSARGRSRAGDT